MALFRARQRREATVDGPVDPYGDRARRTSGAAAVTSDTALRNSAVWAALRLRANLISTMPIDAFRDLGGVSIKIPDPPILVNPGGERVDMMEWLYSSQMDLDRGGNSFGIITETNGLGLPARIDLQPLGICSVIVKGGDLWRYRIGGKLYEPREVWHERQYTVSGSFIGLSPIAYAAWTIGHYLTLQRFATEWFGANQVPSAHLKNVDLPTITDDQSTEVKSRFRTAVTDHDLFVTGKGWEYHPVQSVEAGAEWLASMNATPIDVARFMDVPGDLIEAAVSGSSITYANIVQRNLQLLIMHLNPALRRRELAFSRGWLARPRFVRFNRPALLQMDPATQAAVLGVQIDKRTLTPDEARLILDRPPLTETDLALFDRLFGAPRSAQPAATPNPAGAEAALAAGPGDAAELVRATVAHHNGNQGG